MEENNTVFKKIYELGLANKCNVGPSFLTSGSLYISVIDNKTCNSDFTIINSDCAEELIIDVIKDTIRRAKEV